MSWYRLLLYAYPREFRARFGRDLEELFADLARAQPQPLSRRAQITFVSRILIDTVAAGLLERLSYRRRLPFRVHHVKGPPPMSLLLEDLRHAVRALLHQRGLSSVILVTLALAIGANSAIFSVVNAVLLRPLPYTDPDRVGMVRSVDRAGRPQLVSIPDFEDLRRELRTISGLSLMGTQTANLTGVGEPDRLRAGFVTAEFFTLLGVQPIIGRSFAPGDDARGARKTAVMGYDTWRARFGSDPGIVGRALVLNNEPHEVIGVLPARFEFPVAENDIWLPYGSLPSQDRQRTSRNWFALGRLAAGATAEQADAELRQVTAAMALASPETNSGWSARFDPIHDLSVMFVNRNLRLLMGAVGFVLIIACANIANLLLARASSRQREIAVRSALGASRARIIRQLLVESTLLSGVGGVLGLLLSAAFADGVLALLPLLPRSQFVRPDLTVIIFTSLVSLTTGIVFGLVPAWRLSRSDLRTTLNESGRGGEARSAGRLRGALVVAELALSLVLLTGAGLFIQSLTRLINVDLGYDPRGVLTMEYRLPRNKYPKPDQQIEFHQRVIEQIEAVPGIRTAAIAGSVPQSGNGSIVGFWKAEDAQPAREGMPRAQLNVITPNYFSALGIALLQGRTCGREDVRDKGFSVIVNRLLAEQMWPNEGAVGRRLRSLDFPGEAVVIGVVNPTRPNLLSQPMAPQIYGCLSQAAGIFATVIVKTGGEPLAHARAVQQAIWSVDPDQPMWKIRSSEAMIQSSVQRERAVMMLMSFAAGLALLLAGLGTYSVLSYTVQRRAREVGVRMALGATRGSISKLVLTQTAALTLTGVALGLAGAYALAQVVASQLYEVSARDPFTFIATATLLTAVALVAAWLPTRRATSVDPLITLRTE